MANRLSYSQINKYKYCPAAWNFHYNLRVRSTTIPSALIFGSAIGKVFEYELKLKQDPKSVTLDKDITGFFDHLPIGQMPSAIELFDYYWNYAVVNDKLIPLKENPDIQWLKSDHDEELGATPWESMRAKGHLIIRSFIQNFLPMVEKVYSTEELVELTSGEDSSIGYADAVLQLKDIHSPVVIDFKTAGKAYTQNSVKESIQLGQYLYILGEKYDTKLAGYAVFLKNIVKNRTKICKNCGFDGSGTKFKTCNNQVMFSGSEVADGPIRCNGEWQETINPECKFQLIIDTIPEEFQESVIAEIGAINDQITEGTIVKNLEACHNNFGKSCEFINLCHNSSMAGLIILDKKEA